MTETSVAGENWAGTHTYRASRLVEARSVEEVQAVVAESARVRALGTRHSFNTICDTEGTLVTVTRIPADPVLDAEARTVTVGGGASYGAVATFLESHGRALHNLGSLPHISVAGAVATGTHGSGNANGVLGTAVRGIELVVADGSLRTLRRGDDDFAGAVVSLGALGIVTRLTLDVEPTYRVRQDLYRRLPWPALLADVEAVTGSAYSVSLFTRWSGDHLEEAWVKRRVDGESAVPDGFFGARREPDQPSLVVGAGTNLTARGVAGPWCDGLPHFRRDSTPSVGAEIQSEYFVGMADAAAALEALRGLGPALEPHLVVSELRTVRADDLWLSPAFGRDTLAIHFTWKREPAAVAALLPRVEAVLAPYAPRPHWGKAFTPGAFDVDERYPMAGRFRRLAARLDPGGKLANEYVVATLGVGGS